MRSASVLEAAADDEIAKAQFAKDGKGLAAGLHIEIAASHYGVAVLADGGDQRGEPLRLFPPRGRLVLACKVTQAMHVPDDDRAPGDEIVHPHHMRGSRAGMLAIAVGREGPVDEALGLPDDWQRLMDEGRETPERLPGDVALPEIAAGGGTEVGDMIGQDMADIVIEIGALWQLETEIAVDHLIAGSVRRHHHFLQAKHVGLSLGEVADQRLVKTSAPAVKAHDVDQEANPDADETV